MSWYEKKRTSIIYGGGLGRWQDFLDFVLLIDSEQKVLSNSWHRTFWQRLFNDQNWTKLTFIVDSRYKKWISLISSSIINHVCMYVPKTLYVFVVALVGSVFPKSKKYVSWLFLSFWLVYLMQNKAFIGWNRSFAMS